MSEKVTIQKILEGEDNDARLYRDIMRYHLYKFRILDKALLQRIEDIESEDVEEIVKVVVEEAKGPDSKFFSLLSFRFTELGNWLLEKHLPFINEYAGSHLPKSYRLHAKRNYIQSRIDDLIKLRLIQKIGTVKSEKNKTINTPTYSFTIAGKFLGYLIEARNKNKRATKEEEDLHLLATNSLFSSLDVKLEIMSGDSLSLFLMKFFARCKKKEVIFDHLINVWAPGIFSFFFPTESSRFRMRQTLLTLPALAPDIGRIFLDTLNELDEQTQKLLLFQIKLDFESDYGESSHAWGVKFIKEWELMRFQSIQDYSKITLLGTCKKCISWYPFQLDIFKFLELKNLFKTIREQKSGRLLTILESQIDCLKCGKHNSLRIVRSWIDPVLWTGNKEKIEEKELIEIHRLLKEKGIRLEEQRQK